MGCGPEIPESWQIVDTLDLGIQLRVDELGPLGDPPDPMGRSFHRAMPLDRVRASVFVADTDGPVPAEELSFAWFLCAGAGGCSENAPQTPCPEDGFPLEGECTLGVHGSTTFSFADVLPLVPEGDFRTPEVFVRAIGSRIDDGGAEECLDRLERRTDLGACMILETFYGLGSLGELVALAESRGLEVPEDLVPETARQLPRNRVPAIEQVAVTRAQGQTEFFEAGATIPATIGETLAISWLPEDGDREETTIVSSDGTRLEYEDSLSVSWWTTEPAPAFEFLPAVPRLRWELGPNEGTYTLFAVVTDASQAQGWASFEVEVTR